MKTSAQQSVFDFYFSFPFSAYVQIYFSFTLVLVMDPMALSILLKNTIIKVQLSINLKLINQLINACDLCQWECL